MAISLTYTFTAGTRILSSQVNSNFSTLATRALDKQGDTMAGNLLFTDATYDIGASGATRPRDLFLSRNATVGGTLGVTGNTTLSGTLGVTGNTTLSGTLTVGGVAVPSSPSVQTTTSTGSQNNFAQTAARYLFLRCNNATLLTFTGLTAGSDGDIIDIAAVNAQVDLDNQSTSSTEANRIICGVTGTISLAGGSGRARLIYDGTTDRWRVLEHEQGAWITRTFVAGNYTGSSSMTWTVASGDVTRDAYWLKGRTLHFQTTISTSDIANGDLNLFIAIPGGFTSAGAPRGPATVADNSVFQLGEWGTSASGTTVSIQKLPAGNWTNGTATTAVRVDAIIEVQ